MKVAVAALALAGCAAPRPAPPIMPRLGAFGPEQSFTGILALGFERQSFNDCWLNLRSTAGADLARLAPSPALADERAGYVADVTLVGRRRAVEDASTGPALRGSVGFGHLNLYPCEIEATRIVSARLKGQ